jgi:ankyrin repeat protein
LIPKPFISKASWKGFKEIVTLLAPLSDTNRLCTVPVLKRPRPSASSNIDFDETPTPTPSRKTTTVQKPALIAAVNRGHIDIVYTLLYCGADPNQVDHKGHTALSHAAKDGRLDIVEILVTQGADPKLRSKGGRMPVHKARKYKHFEVVDYLEKCI